jgi:hypothetical protein
MENWKKMSKYQLYFNAFTAVADEAHLRGRWLSDTTWFNEIKAAVPSLADLGFDRNHMNSALGRKDIGLDDFDTNTSGRYHRTVKMDDPHGEINAKTGKVNQLNVTMYFVADPRKPVQQPPEGDTLFAAMAADFEIHSRRCRAACCPETLAELDRDIERKFPKARPQSDSKPRTPLPVHLQSFFDSPEAKKLFIGDSKSSKDVETILQDHKEMLSRVNEYPSGWRDAVDRHDKDNLCSAYDIFILRQKSQILCLSYT